MYGNILRVVEQFNRIVCQNSRSETTSARTCNEQLFGRIIDIVKYLCHQLAIIIVSFVIDGFCPSVQCGIFFCVRSRMEIAVTIGYTDKSPIFKDVFFCGISDSPFLYGISHNVQPRIHTRIVKSALNIHRPCGCIIVYTETAAIKV